MTTQRRDVTTPSPALVHPALVHEAFAYQANLAPSSTALVDEMGNRIDYLELRERSARLARRLQAFGIGPDERVAVYMSRSADAVVSMLAILEAGGCYVPIDDTYPADRVAAMLKYCEPRVLIAKEPPPERVLSPGLNVIAPDAADTGPFEPPQAQVGLDHLAYVIYTSGSTGTPKGVAMPHRGLSRLIDWQIDDGPMGLTTLQFTPLCFDVTFQEVFSTLCSGGTLVLVSDTVRRDPEQLLDALDRQSIERLFLPYTALQQLADTAVRIGKRPRTLRHVLTAGEQLIVTDAISRFFQAMPRCRLDNQYGPTETHLVTRYTLGGDAAAWPKLPPIGAAARGVTLYCLDPNLQPVPADEPGDLYVGGDGLARGYLNDADLTRERFLPDPFAGEPRARMYKTGDVGRIGADGTAHFLGRADDQIKVRGFRVEPGEVELVLASHPRVRHAAVGLREIGPAVHVLVGYIVTDGAPVTAPELAAHVRERLPEYMTPARFVFVESLPRTSTGKVDRRRLATDIELPPLAPIAVDTSSLTDTVTTIWQRVLGHAEFAPDDDFFDVGGDSLLAMWVVTELGLATGREMNLSMLLDDSTVRGIAASLDALSVSTPVARSASEAVTLRAGPSNRVLYLLHPLGGELIAYRDLARAVRSPLRVLGLRWQPHDLDRATSLRDMAAAHAELLHSIQPIGPYLLAGWSFGGVLAYELARQLQACGNEVEFLGLLDANPARDTTTGVLARDTAVFAPLKAAIADLEASGEAADSSVVLADRRVSDLVGGVPEGVPITHLRRTLRITAASMQAAMEYDAVPYTGPIDLFQPADAAAATRESLHAELRRYARGELRIHTVPGDHYSMLRSPFVTELARELDAALASANSPAHQPHGTLV